MPSGMQRMRSAVPGRGMRSVAAKPEAPSARRHKPDFWLVTLCVILLVVGLVVVYAISPALSESAHVGENYFVVKQLIAIGLSLVAFGVTSQVPLRAWRQWYKPLLIVAGLATLIALVMPVNPNYPAHRWVRLGSFSFQSVELLKFAVLIWLAGFLSDRVRTNTIKDTQKTLKPVLGAIVALVLIVAGVQSDLGSAAVMIAMIGVMAFVAGMPIKRLAMIAGIIAVGVVLLISSTPYRRARIAAYLHPEQGCQTTSGYQACQALIAVGSGGMVGLGLGRSVQAYGYLPEAANDSIFAIYAEKFGFIGTTVLLGLLAALFARIKNAAERAADNFQLLIAVGILTWLSIQSLINIGAMIGILPLKGITLPFISYGGTSVVFVAAAVGLVFQISHYTSFVGRKSMNNSRRMPGDNRTNGRRVRGAYNSGLSGRTRN